MSKFKVGQLVMLKHTNIYHCQKGVIRPPTGSIGEVIPPYSDCCEDQTGVLFINYPSRSPEGIGWLVKTHLLIPINDPDSSEEGDTTQETEKNLDKELVNEN